jgi:hypothetical protein
MRWKDDHEYWVNKDLEGSNFGIFEGTIPALA